MKVNLSKFDNSWYNPGRSLITRILWYFVNALFLQSALNPSSLLKIFFLKIFGAKIGNGVILKPSINVKYPWNLEIGDYSWVGEKTWLDSLGKIRIGNNCCISQGTYFCSGNLDWTDTSFGLIVKSITLEDGVWVGARVTVLPGVTIKENSFIAAGSVLSKDTEPYMIYVGNPALPVRKRVILEK
jgi:putative colanic acid biosynthesis acetyltransferase WcaF